MTETTSFLDSLGFDPGYLIMGMIGIMVILIILIIFVFTKYDTLQKKFVRFMQGRDGKNLEELLAKIVDDNRKVKIQCKNNIDAILDLKKNNKENYSRIGIVRYDTLNENSGKLSFALALLNENYDGIILNSIYSSHGSYQYLKKIVNASCETELSEEEQDALDEAIEEKTEKSKENI